MKYMKEIERQFKSYRYPVFKSYELETFGVGKKYKKRLIHLMLSNSRINRITKGVYTFHKDVDVVGFAFSPFYYGMEDALSIRGISEQGTNPIIVTTRNVRQGKRSFIGRNYIVRRIPEEHFFGYGMLKHGDFWVPVSDVEKTVIDLVYFDHHITEEHWSEIIKLLDSKKLNEYLQRYKIVFREKVHKMLKEAKNRSH